MAKKLHDGTNVNRALQDLADMVGPRRAERVVQASLNFAAGKASPLAKMARALAPVRQESLPVQKTYKGNVKAPGYLSRNLDFKPIKGQNLVLFGPKSEAFYGTTFLENQSGKHGNHGPWLEPAFNATQGQTLKRFSERLKQNIEKTRNKALAR